MVCAYSSTCPIVVKVFIVGDEQDEPERGWDDQVPGGPERGDVDLKGGYDIMC